MVSSDTTRRRPHEEAAPDEINSGHLRAFVERVERIREEQKSLADDLKEIYAEVKSNGFVPKIVKKIVQIRAQDPDARSEEETLTDLYLAALGQG